MQRLFASTRSERCTSSVRPISLVVEKRLAVARGDVDVLSLDHEEQRTAVHRRERVADFVAVQHAAVDAFESACRRRRARASCRCTPRGRICEMRFVDSSLPSTGADDARAADFQLRGTVNRRSGGRLMAGLMRTVSTAWAVRRRAIINSLAIATAQTRVSVPHSSFWAQTLPEFAAAVWHSHSCCAGRHHHPRLSTIMAMPCPPPMQAEARPYFFWRRRSS